MTRKLAALALASLLSLGATDAFAGGQITIRQSGNGNLVSALQKGQSLLRLIQKGNRNKSAVRQSGNGNVAFNAQFGNDHESTIDQSGGGNLGAVLQFGKGQKSRLVQSGGQADIIIQGGW